MWCNVKRRNWKLARHNSRLHHLISAPRLHPSSSGFLVPKFTTLRLGMITQVNLEIYPPSTYLILRDVDELRVIFDRKNALLRIVRASCWNMKNLQVHPGYDLRTSRLIGDFNLY